MKLYDVPRYSRIKMEGLEMNNKPVGEFNFFYIDGMYSVCENDDGKTFNLMADTEVELICSMKEHDLKSLNK
jgi:hypothetical protein